MRVGHIRNVLSALSEPTLNNASLLGHEITLLMSHIADIRKTSRLIRRVFLQELPLALSTMEIARNIIRERIPY